MFAETGTHSGTRPNDFVQSYIASSYRLWKRQKEKEERLDKYS